MACLATEGPCNGIGGRVVCGSEDDVGVVPNGLQPLGELPRIVWLAFTEDEALPHQQRFPMLVHGGETTKVEPVLVASVGVVMDDEVVEAACRSTCSGDIQKRWVNWPVFLSSFTLNIPYKVFEII